MSSTHDQQPIQRTVGRRQPRDGQPLSDADRAAMTQNAQYRTRAPKDQMDAAVLRAGLEKGGKP